MIRYGLVGVGGYAQSWLRSLEILRQREIATVGSVVVRNPQKYEKELARLRAQGCTVYPTLEAMLAARDVDIIGLPTGIASHAPLAIQALDAGYPVLVEKPLAATIQDALAILEAEQRSGQWCAVGYQWLHSPTIQALADLIRRGELGRIREMRCVIGWPRSQHYYRRNAWAGALAVDHSWVLDGPATNATAHYLTNMFYLLAAQQDAPTEIMDVRAELYRANPIASYDTSCIEVRMGDGARIYHYASHALRRSIEPIMVIHAEHGVIHWQAAKDRAHVTWLDGRSTAFTNPDPDWNTGLPLEQAARTVAGLEPCVLCSGAGALPHVLAINLAFESSSGVHTIPQSVIRQLGAADDRLTAVEGMGFLLHRAMATGQLFSDLGAPWARPTAAFSAQGYRLFPQGEALSAFLAA